LQSIIAEIQKRTSDIKEARILAIAPPAIPGLGAILPVLLLNCNKLQAPITFSSLKR